MKVLKNVLTIIMSVVLWLVILVTALFTFTTLATKNESNVSSIGGFTPLIVQSDSMAPFFYAGDLIVIKSCDTSTLKEGDVITFHTIINNAYALNTHRIESIQTENGIRSYVTKGDNNAIADTHIISDGDIVGKYVFKTSFLGKVMSFLSGTVGFLVVIVLPLLIFFIYQIYHLVMVSINLKKAVAVETAQEAAGNSDETLAKLAEAEAALAEAKRLKEEAEQKLAQMEQQQEDQPKEDQPKEDQQ